MPDNQQSGEDVRELPVDSGMSGEAVETAEFFWANLPRVPKWTSLLTHEKALVCHTLARHSALSTDALREADVEHAALAIRQSAVQAYEKTGRETDWAGASWAQKHSKDFARAALSTKAPLSMEGSEG